MPSALRPSGLRICAQCGANVPPTLPACEACQGPVSSSVSIPYPPMGLMFVQVRCQFGCVQCGTKSPINTLDADGHFFCFGCNQERSFDTDMWKESLVRLANLAGDAFWTNMRVYPPWPQVMPEEDWLDEQSGWEDLSSMVPRLMKNILPKIGLERAQLTIEQSGTTFGADGMKTGTYDVEVFPGHPLCRRCRSPLEVGFPARGIAQACCRFCQVNEIYNAPYTLLQECPELVAALADDLVKGWAPARLEAKAGAAALAILCPQCGSSLSIAPGTRVAMCQYCKTSSLIPERAMSSAGKAPAPQAWWMVLAAPCSLRTLLSAPGAGRTQDDDDDA
jgi:hypothetical protein